MDDINTEKDKALMGLHKIENMVKGKATEGKDATKIEWDKMKASAKKLQEKLKK